MQTHWLTRERFTDSALEVGEVRISAAGERVRLRVPGLPVQLRWSRPTAVIVERRDGTRTEVPVRDVTRWRQLALLAAGLAAGLALWTALSRGGRSGVE